MKVVTCFLNNREEYDFVSPNEVWVFLINIRELYKKMLEQHNMIHARESENRKLRTQFHVTYDEVDGVKYVKMLLTSFDVIYIYPNGKKRTRRFDVVNQTINNAKSKYFEALEAFEE